MTISHPDRAEELFRGGYNCSQAVAGAFCDVTGMSLGDAVKYSAPFGGGFGRLREVCGAASGGCLVLGALYGAYPPDDAQAKASHYALVREFMNEFKNRAGGSYVCRELLGEGTTPGGTPSPRTDEFYKKRPCPGLVRLSAEILDEIIKNKK